MIKLIDATTMERVDMPERDALRTAVRTLAWSAEQREYAARSSEGTDEDMRIARALHAVATFLHVLSEQSIP